MGDPACGDVTVRVNAAAADRSSPVRTRPGYGGAVTNVIVVNGGSSSGKSGVIRCLQHVLPDPWLALGTDTMVDALPASMRSGDSDGDGDGLGIGGDGEVTVGAAFRELEAAWIAGVAAMARAGARVLVDEVFLGGAASQRRWREALAGLDVLWVGVRCDSTVAAGRELARGDRVPGMAVMQANLVHEGVVYDLEVDTTHTEALACARVIAGRVRGESPSAPAVP